MSPTAWRRVHTYLREKYGRFRPGEEELLDKLQSFRPTATLTKPWREIGALADILKRMKCPPFVFIHNPSGKIQEQEPTEGKRNWSREPSCMGLIPWEWWAEVHDCAFPDSPRGAWPPAVGVKS